MTKRDLPSSGNNEWETPPDIFNHWYGKFIFQLDVAASKSNHKVPAYFTKEDNALEMPWSSSNWMNPPYGRGMILPFVAKALNEAGKGNLTVGLLPVATSTQWWQKYVSKADHVYFYPHRINFLQNGKVVKGVAFDPCIVIWGLHPATKGADNGK